MFPPPPRCLNKEQGAERLCLSVVVHLEVDRHAGGEMKHTCIAFAVIAATLFCDAKTKTITVTIESEEELKPIVPISAQVVPPAAIVQNEPPPPPEPKAMTSADPRKLVRYFCRQWKDENYEAMWWAMTPKYRTSVSLKKFISLFEADAERTGGLKDENITMPDVDEGKLYTVTVDLTFAFARAKGRRVKAVLEKNPKTGYRIRESGIIPLDLDNL